MDTFDEIELDEQLQPMPKQPHPQSLGPLLPTWLGPYLDTANDDVALWH